jgi:hypothetical protein
MADDRLLQVEHRLHEIDEALAALRHRLVALEHPDASSIEHATAATAEPAGPIVMPLLETLVPSSGRTDPARLLSLAGRTLVILGGAYLLRALTESGRLPQTGGVALGFAYASVWIGAADRAAIRRPVSGLFFGLAGIMLGAALIWEASTRFTLLAPGPSAAVLGLFAVAALVVAWHRQLESLAVVVTVAGGVTAMALAGATDRMAPYALCAIAIFAVTSWFGTRGWQWPRWPAGVMADLLVLAVVVRTVGRPEPIEPAAGGAAASVCLTMVWLGTVIVSALARRDPQPFDVLQTTAVVVVGVGGGLAVAADVSPAVRAAAASAVLALGAAGYLVVLARRQALSLRALTYLATTAMTLLLWGEIALFSSSAAGALSATALALLLAGRQLGLPIATVHAAVFVGAASLSSGLLSLSARIWTGSPPFPAPESPALIAIAVAAAGLLVAGSSARDLRRSVLISRAALAVVLVSGAGALIVAGLIRMFGGAEAAQGVVASLKTITLAMGALALAAAARVSFGRELSWLAAPLLVAAGLKVVMQDLRVAPAALLFVVLGIYGVSLILTSRLSTRRGPPPRGSL